MPIRGSARPYSPRRPIPGGRTSTRGTTSRRLQACTRQDRHTGTAAGAKSPRSAATESLCTRRPRKPSRSQRNRPGLVLRWGISPTGRCGSSTRHVYVQGASYGRLIPIVAARAIAAVRAHDKPLVEPRRCRGVLELPSYAGSTSARFAFTAGARGATAAGRPRSATKPDFGGRVGFYAGRRAPTSRLVLVISR